MSFLSKLNSKNLLLGTLILTLIVLRLPSLFEPHWSSIEGFNFAVANCLQNGQLLYKDIWFDKPPLLIVFYYLANLFGSFDLLVIKTLGLLSSTGTLILTFKIAEKLLTQKVAFLSSFITLIMMGVPILDANLATSTLFSLFFITAGIYQFIKIDFKTNFLSGFLLGLALCININSIFGILALVICTILINKKKSLKMLIQFTLGVSVLVVSLLYFLYLQGTLSNFFQIVLADHFRAIYDATSSSFGFLLVRNSLLSRFGIFAVGFSLLIYLYAKTKFSRVTLLLSLLTLFLTFGVFYHKTTQTSNLLLLAPLFAIITSLVLRKVKDAKFSPKIQVISIYLLGLFFFLSTFFNGLPFSKSTHVRNYYTNFIVYLAGKKTSQSYISSFADETNSMYKLDSFLIQNFENVKNVYVWTDNPWIYELSDLNTPVRYLYSSDALQNWGEVKSYLVKNSPQLIIINKNTQGTIDLIDFTTQNHYQLEREFETYLIYKKTTQISQV